MAAKPAGSRGSGRAPAAQPTVTTTTTVTGVTDPAAPAATGGAAAVVVEKPQPELPKAAPDQPDPPPAAPAPQDSLAVDLRIGGPESPPQPQPQPVAAPAPAVPPQPAPPPPTPPTPHTPPDQTGQVVFLAPQNMAVWEQTLRATGETNSSVRENTAEIKNLTKEIRENLGAQRQQSTTGSGGNPPPQTVAKNGGDGSSGASASSLSSSNWPLILLFFLFLAVLLVVIYVLEPWKLQQTKQILAPATQPSSITDKVADALNNVADAVKSTTQPADKPEEPAKPLNPEEAGTRLDLDTDGETTETWIAINRDLGKPGAKPSMPRKLGGPTYIIEKEPPTWLKLEDDEYYGDLYPHWWGRKDPIPKRNAHIKVIRKTLEAGAAGTPAAPAPGPAPAATQPDTNPAATVVPTTGKHFTEDQEWYLLFTPEGDDQRYFELIPAYPHGEVWEKDYVLTIKRNNIVDQPIKVSWYMISKTPPPTEEEFSVSERYESRRRTTIRADRGPRFHGGVRIK